MTDDHGEDGFDPDEYTYVGSIDTELLDPVFVAKHQIPPTNPMYRNAQEWNERLNQDGVDWTDGAATDCDHCGNSMRYTVIFKHEPSGQFVVAGRQCAENRFQVDRSTYEIDRLQEQQQKRRTRRENRLYRDVLAELFPEATTYLEDQADREYPFSLRPPDVREAKKAYHSEDPQPLTEQDQPLLTGVFDHFQFLEDHPRLYRAIDREHQYGTGEYRNSGDTNAQFFASLAEQYRKYGDLSDNQIETGRNLLDEQVQSARQQAFGTNPVVPEERVTITGTVLKTDIKGDKYDPHGRRHVMTLESDEGWVIHGTLPKAFRDEGDHTVSPGDRIQLNGTCEPSDDDPTFGFYSNPRNARRIEESPDKNRPPSP